MAATGMVFLYNLVREFCVMGVIPVVLGMPKVMRFLEIILDYFDADPPDMVVLIDYPGFNLYLATHTRKRGIRTFFYVTPQIWAWAPWRINKIKRLIDKMLVIFPFEVPFYEKAQVPVEYVGHPLLDRMASFSPDVNFRSRHGLPEKLKILALLPGSRKSEIERNLPSMLWAASELAQKEEIVVLLALSSNKYLALCNRIGENLKKRMSIPPVKVVQGETHQIVHHAHMAMVTSGTATLETAILGKPMIVLYYIPKVHKWLVDHTSFIKCKYIALPNIISEKRIVPEHVYCELCPPKMLEEFLALWEDGEKRRQCFDDLREMARRIERPGASEKAADAILRALS